MRKMQRTKKRYRNENESTHRSIRRNTHKNKTRQGCVSGLEGDNGKMKHKRGEEKQAWGKIGAKKRTSECQPCGLDVGASISGTLQLWKRGYLLIRFGKGGREIKDRSDILDRKESVWAVDVSCPVAYISISASNGAKRHRFPTSAFLKE